MAGLLGPRESSARIMDAPVEEEIVSPLKVLGEGRAVSDDIDPEPTDQEVINYDPLKDKSGKKLLVDPEKAFETRQELQTEREIDKTFRKGLRAVEKKNRIRDRFEQRMAERNFQYKELNISPPTTRDVVNLLIGDDASIVGFKWDQEGMSWNIENMKETWSEDPLWLNAIRTFSLGLNFVPGAAAINKSFQVGKLGKKLEKGFEFVDWTQDVADPTLQPTRWFNKFKTQQDEAAWLSEKGFLLDTKNITEAGLKVARQAARSEQDIAKRLTIRRAIDTGEDSYIWAGKEQKITAWHKMKNAVDSQFANEYWNIANATRPDQMRKFNQSLENFHKAEDTGRFFRDMPDELVEGKFGTNIMKYWLDPANNVLDPTMAKETRAWAVGLRESMEMHQEQMVELGAYSEEMLQRMPRHVPMQYDYTPMPEVRKGIKKYFDRTAKAPDEVRMTQKWPDLESETWKYRQADLPDIMRRLDDMEQGTNVGPRYITDPANVTLRGWYTDRQLYHNLKFMRDAVADGADKGYALTYSAVKARRAAGDKVKGYVDLDNMPVGKNVFRRVLEKHRPDLIEEGRMPHVSKAVWNEWFGQSGIFHQTEVAGDFLHALVAFHKTMKTTVNPQTQLNNLVGNQIKLSWAGFNPLTPTNIQMGQDINTGLFKMLNIRRLRKLEGNVDERTAQSLRNLGAGKEVPEEILDEYIRSNKIKLGKINVVNSEGKKVSINLNEHFANPLFKDLVEYNAFTDVEGLQQVRRIYDRMGEGIPKKFVNTMLKMGEVPGLGRGLETAGDLYLAGDIVPKAQLYFKYIADGLSPQTSAMMVARYMPMYRTTGRFVSGARRWALPWITYPSEVLRIAKNQMMDNPMRLYPWMMAVDMLQGGIMLTNDLNPAAVEEGKNQLPMWARTPETVVAPNQEMAQLQGLLGGAAAGAALGGVSGLPMGATVGAAAGSVGGYLLGSQAQDQDKLRGAVLGWLPLSSLNLGIDPRNAPEFYQNFNVQKAIETSPVEPFAIMKPMIDIMAGRTAYGTEIGATGPMDQAGKMWAGLVGFLAPPLVQTYGFKITTPEESGGIAAGLAGAAVGGAAGAAVGGVGGAVGGALLGGVTGSAMNVSRILTDSGAKVDPRTMRTKEAPVDFILNNIGVMKSYQSLPENKATHEKTVARELGGIRSHLKKQVSYHFVNGNKEQASQGLEAIKATFSQEYPLDPATASEKWHEWMERFIDKVGESPMWSGYSKERMKREIKRVRRLEANERSLAMEDWANSLKAMRRM